MTTNSDQTERVSVGDIRCTILKAIDILTEENNKLKNQNEEVTKEVDKLRRENRVMRQELLALKSERDDAVKLAANFEKELMEVRKENSGKMEQTLSENKRLYETETELRDEVSECKASLARLERDYMAKEKEVKDYAAGVEDLRFKLEQATRQVICLREKGDAELVEQLNMMSRQTKSVQVEYTALQRINEQLQADNQEIEATLQERTAELRNEKRKQNLLMKEFNSLLDENNHLKLQLKRKTPDIRSQEIITLSAISEQQNIITLAHSSFTASPRTSRHHLPSTVPTARLSATHGIVRSSLPPHTYKANSTDSRLSTSDSSSKQSASNASLLPYIDQAGDHNSSADSSSGADSMSCKDKMRQKANVRTVRGVDFTQASDGVVWRAV